MMTTKRVKSPKAWHVILWVAQVLLAGMFLMAGFVKTFVPLEELSKMIPMASEMPALTRFIGVSEIAGGLGLLLPAGLRIWPGLTVLAATALAVIMVLAIGFHIARGESIGTTVVLGILAAFVAWGRLNKAPIAARSERTHSILQ